MSSAGWAAFGTILQGAGKIGQDYVNSRNQQIAAENHDEVMRWAEEQSRLSEGLRSLKASGIELDKDDSVAKSQLRAAGYDPDAAGSFDQWLAAKDRDGVRSIQQAAQSLGVQAGGTGSAMERGAHRSWSSPTMDELRPDVVRFSHGLLGRSEQGTSDLDSELERLQRKQVLMGQYGSYLSDSDWKAIQDQVKAISDQRRDRVSADNSLRGDQAAFVRDAIGYDRTMDQSAFEADARSKEGDKNRANERAIARISAGSRERVAGLRSSDKKDLAAWQRNAETQVQNLRLLRARAAMLKGRRFESADLLARALGARADEVGGFLTRGGYVDLTPINNKIIVAEANLERANRVVAHAFDPSGDQVGAPSTAPSPGASLPVTGSADPIDVRAIVNRKK